MLRSEQEGIIAGLEEATALFTHFGILVRSDVADGAQVTRGDTLLSLRGNAKKILLVERTVLNIIGRMSGIEPGHTSLAGEVSKITPHCRVAGTRKTCPGFGRSIKRQSFLEAANHTAPV